MRSPNAARCVYCNRTHRLIDMVMDGEAADTAIGRLAEEHGTDLVVLDFKEASTREDDAHRTEPEEITGERYQEMLEILPPVGWRAAGNGESFKLSEPLIGSIHAIFVKLNHRHFTFHDRITLKHDDICAKVFHSAAYRQPAEPTKSLAFDMGRKW